MRIKVVQDIMAANNMIARENRRIFDQHGVFVVNLMSSPGAGKTTLLERTLAALKDEFAMASSRGTFRASWMPSASGVTECRCSRSTPAASAIWTPT